MAASDRPLTDFDRACVQAYQTWVSLGRPEDPSKAASALGLARHTFSNRLLKYYLRDLGSRLPVEMQPGHEIKAETMRLDADGAVKGRTIRTGLANGDDGFEVPEGHRVKGVSAFVDSSGNVIGKWVKTDEQRRSEEVIEKAAKLAAERYAGPAAPLRHSFQSRGAVDTALLNTHLLPDLHLGLHASAWSAQRDWSLETAVAAYKEAFRALFEAAPNAKTGLILGGGDLLHYDDPTKMTRRSGHVLDGAEPWEVCLSAAEDLLVHTVELALQKYPRVRVRILKGNHDDDSSVAVAHYLAAWFRNEPRADVILSGSIYHVEEHGVNMLGYTHGHELRIEDLPGVMAADEREMWGRCRFAQAHGFHVHHKKAAAGVANSVPWETWESPAPRDDHHQAAGYRGPQRLPVITYHAERGEKRRITELL